MKKIELLQEKLKDERGKKVIFLSHCLLNENTRYLGGAFRKAGVDEIVDILRQKEIGVVQMPCPEQKAWGGVLKQKMLIGYGIKGTFLSAFRKVYMIFFIWNTKRSYRKIAQEIVYQINDYVESGYKVLGIAGVKGSPSCGVSASLDLNKSSKFVADLDIQNLSKEYFNNNCYKDCIKNQSGIFFDELKNELSAKGLNVKLFEHDLLQEIKGEKSNFDIIGEE